MPSRKNSRSEAKGSSTGAKDGESKKDSGSKSVNINSSRSYSEVVKKMPADKAEKITKYINASIKNIRTTGKQIKSTHTRSVKFSSDTLRFIHNISNEDEKHYSIVDGGADTGMKGSKTSIFLEHTNRKVNVSGFDNGMVKEGLPLGTCASRVTDENGNAIILIENEQIDHSEQENSIFSVNQVRSYGVDVDDCPNVFHRDGQPGRMNMIADEHTIPFEYRRNLVLLEARVPTANEFNTLPIVIITSALEWNPENDEFNSANKTSQWTPLDSEDDGIRNAELHAIVSRRLDERESIYRVGNSDSRHIHVSNIEILDEDDVDLPALVSRSYHSDSSDEDSINEPGSIPDLIDRGDVDSLLSSDDEFSDDELSVQEFKDEISVSTREDMSKPIERKEREAYNSLSDDSSCEDSENDSNSGDSMPALRIRDDDDSSWDSSESDSMPALGIRDDDDSSCDSSESDSMPALGIRDDDDSSCDSSESDEDSINLTTVVGDTELELDDDITIPDITSGNEMTRHILTTCTFDKLHDDSTYTKSFCYATHGNVMEYVSRVANVRGARGLRPRRQNTPIGMDISIIKDKFGYVSDKVMTETLKITTQLGTRSAQYPLKRHFKSRIPGANVRRIHETFSTDTMFSSVPAIGGATCCQLFVGNTSSFTAVYGMTREGEGLGTLERFVNEWGAPDAIRRDNSKMQNSVGWKKFEQKMQIKCELTEPYNQQMNPAERRIQTAKSNTNKLMDRTGTPKFMWLHCMIYAVAILNMACMDRLQGRNAHEVAFGHSLDISAYIQYSWWEKVYFLDTEDPSFPRSKEKLGHFCGVAENVGDLLTFQIYVPSSHQVIHRSVLRSADDKSTAGPPNLRALNPHYNNEDDEHEEMAELEIEIEEATNAAERQDGSGVIDSDDEISLGDISHIDRNDTLQTSIDL